MSRCPTGLVRIDPALRGSISPSLLARMARAGLHVHQVGRAAYVHDELRRHRWLLVVTPAPLLEARHRQHHRWLMGRGPATALELRRGAAWLAQRAALRLRAPDGRDGGAIPWWATVDSDGRMLTPRAEQPWRLA